VTQLTELTCIDQLTRQAHRRHEAVVERAHVLHAGCRDATPDVVALVRVTSERLFADHVLARLGRGDRRSRVHVVRPQIVEEPDRGVGDEFLPPRRRALEAVASCRGCDGRGVAAGNRNEPRLERRRPRDIGDLAEGVRMRLAHERVAEHPDADLGQCVHQASASGGSLGMI